MKNFRKLKTFTKLLEHIRPNLIKNYNYDNNVKLGHFWPYMDIWFTDCNGKRITDKKMQFTGVQR